MEIQSNLKKVRERRVLDRFIELSHDFPLGEIKESDKERPDFIYQSEGRTIGIELTRIYIDDVGNGSKLKQQEIDRKKIGECIVEEVKRYYSVPFVLHIHYSYHHELERLRKPEIIRQCTISCLDVLLNEDDGYFKIENHPMSRFELPQEIESIVLHIQKKLGDSYYSEGAAAAIPNLQDKHLLHRLEEKNRKKKGYKTCDEYWLIIEEGTFAADTFGDIEVTMPIQSDFDQVFLYRRGKAEIIILKQ